MYDKILIKFERKHLWIVTAQIKPIRAKKKSCSILNLGIDLYTFNYLELSVLLRLLKSTQILDKQSKYLKGVLP